MTSVEVEDRRAKKLLQIKALLDQANNTPYSEEAATFRAKAEQLMVAFRISEHEIREAQQGPLSQPVLREIIVVERSGNVVKPFLLDIFVSLCRFSHCEAVYLGLTDDGPCTAKVVGFPEDIDYLDLLFTSLALQFSQELNPHVNPNLPRGENIYNMKAAGLTWEEIFRRLDVPFKDAGGNNTKWHGILMREYKGYCAEHMLKPITANPKTWIRNFGQGYVARINERLFEIRRQQRVQAENEKDRAVQEKYALVLRDRDAIVADKFKEFFPYVTYRKPAKMGGTTNLSDARSSGSHAGSKADLGTGGSLRNQRKELGS